MKPSYAHIKQQLPKEIFRPYVWRLIPIILVFLTGVTSVALIATQGWPWYIQLCLGLLTGYCWGIGGLFAHELLHGAVVRNRKVQDFIGFFTLLPFIISPTFWRHWHNNLHHSHTQRAIVDPDAYPLLKVFKQSKFAQWMFPFSPGSGHKRSYLYFFFWFSFNCQVIQHYLRYRNGNFKKLDHKKVNIELFSMIAIHIAALAAIGPQNWFFAVLIPFMGMNYLPFSYISTNHNLSPLTKSNDPLVNSLTVTNHPILEYFHINFGYHVEHHLYPTLSGIHLKKVREILIKDHSDTYQSMPKWKAIKALYSSPRIYKDSKTLVHPYTGRTVKTVGSVEKPVGVKEEILPTPAVAVEKETQLSLQ